MKSLFAIGYLLLVSTLLARQEPDWKGVQDVFGRKGTIQSGMLKETFPRNDLNVKVGEVDVSPRLALTSWIAFRLMDTVAMAMGDMVLLEPEIGPVMKKLLADGVEVSALHNHIINETPKVMYMHFGGRGNPVQLATTLNDALALTGTPLGPPPLEKTDKLSITDWSQVRSIMGSNGQGYGNVLQFSYPRSEEVVENGMALPPFLGTATGINIQMVGQKAATTGDFVLLASEVNPVAKALADNGIAVTAIHNHMLNENPRLFMMHFWGYDDPSAIARALRKALDVIRK